MSNLTIPISNIAYSVERPIIYDIVRQVMDVTEISSDVPIKYMGEESRSLQPNSTIGSDPAEDNYSFKNNWPFKERMEVEISEEYDVDRMLSTDTFNAGNIPIFRDDKLDILMRPIYGITNVTITFKYRAKDRNAALTWRNNIKTRTSMGRDIILHDINYSYHIPNIYIEILKEIYTLREKVAGYNETFDTYLQNNLSGRAGTVSKLDGSDFEYVVAERQARIQGWFEFSGVPDRPEKVDDGSAYICIFTYKFTYDKPINMNLLYPIVVHNQLLPKKYRTLTKADNLKTRSKTYSLSSLAFSKFEDGMEILESYGNKGLDIPAFDYSFIPGSILPGSARVATVLCTISEADKRSLFNLNNLGKFNIDSDVIKYLKHDKDNITKPYKSIFNLTLYQNGNMRSNVDLLIDDDLNVVSSVDLDLRKTYRVRISLIVNIDMIPGNILAILKSYNLVNISFAIKLGKAISAILKDQGGNYDINKSYLSDHDLVRLGIMRSYIDPNNSMRPINDVIRKYSDLYDPNQVNVNLSQCLFVVAQKMSEL